MYINRYPNISYILLVLFLSVVSFTQVTPALAGAPISICENDFEPFWDAGQPYVMTASDSTARLTELTNGITCANSYSGLTPTIELNGDIILDDGNLLPPVIGTNGNNTFPIVANRLTIDGKGFTIQRDSGATPDYRFFQNNVSNPSGLELTLRNITLDGGLLSAVGDEGGAIRNEGILTLENVTISNSAASNGLGGAIYNSGTLKIINSTFSSNRGANGGAIHNDGGTLNISGSAFSGNLADNLNGGAINNDNNGTTTIQGSTFTNNTAVSVGGALNNRSGTIAFNDSTLSGNSSVVGGGVFNFGTLSITKSTLNNNTSDNSGGGVYTEGGLVTITNSTITGNSAAVGGGVHNVDGGKVTLNNSTLSANAGTTRGGGLVNGDNSEATLNNTILANSTSSADCYNFGSGTVRFSEGKSNIIETNSTTDPCGTPSNYLAFDPGLGSLTGSPAYLPLLAGSPAIDAGDNTTCQANSQNGQARPTDGDSDGILGCDIGAYEVSGSLKPETSDVTYPTTYTGVERNTNSVGFGLADGTQVFFNNTNGVITVISPDGTTMTYRFPARITDNKDGTLNVFDEMGNAVIDRVIITQRNLSTSSQPDSGNEGIRTVTNCRLTTNNPVNLRAEPTVNSADLDTIPYLTPLGVLRVADVPGSENSPWYEVVYNGQAGWVAGPYVTTEGNC